MKVYVHDKGIILIGKSWELNKDYVTVTEWIDKVNQK
jgi:Mother cell inhibitor of FtsZ